MAKEKCVGLVADIKWRRAQIHRTHGNLRGYRIDFEGKQLAAFEIIKQMLKDEGKSPEQDYVDQNSELMVKNRPI
jgi:hypothetical protein